MYSTSPVCFQVVGIHSGCSEVILKLREKVEAASTFRNATRQVAAYDTPTAIF